MAEVKEVDIDTGLPLAEGRVTETDEHRKECDTTWRGMVDGTTAQFELKGWRTAQELAYYIAEFGHKSHKPVNTSYAYLASKRDGNLKIYVCHFHANGRTHPVLCSFCCGTGGY